MAQKVVVHFVDDLDGTVATQTVRFALDGAAYEIDLSDAHAGELRDALRPWVTGGRRTGGRTSTGRTRGTRHRDEQSALVRAWAQEAGHVVAPRGRVPDEVRAAYDAAHSS